MPLVIFAWGNFFLKGGINRNDDVSVITAHGSRLISSSESLSHNTPKFVILGYPYWGITVAAEAWGALMAKKVQNKFLRFLLRVHRSHKLNNIFELPFKAVWDNALFDAGRLNPEDDVYFLFFGGFPMVYSTNYLRHLKAKYRHCRLVRCFMNPIAGPHVAELQSWQSVKEYYDAAITLNRRDAEKHGFLFCEYWPTLLPDKDYQPENASDVFLCAAAKDRLSKILDVYERLTDSGLKCDFWITGVPKKQQKYSQSIHYTEDITNHWLTYDEILQKDMNTKCILEILPFGQNYSSIRVCEALWYHKKLLTTNQEAPREWFYHPEIVQCFTNAEDINPECIRKPLTSEDEQRIFGSMVIGDFGVFADWLIKNVG